MREPVFVYLYTCPVTGHAYDIRIDYDTMWHDDQTHIVDPSVRVVNTTLNTEVYTDPAFVYQTNPEDVDTVIDDLMFGAKVLPIDPDRIRARVFVAMRMVDIERRHLEAALAELSQRYAQWSHVVSAQAPPTGQSVRVPDTPEYYVEIVRLREACSGVLRAKHWWDQCQAELAELKALEAAHRPE